MCFQRPYDFVLSMDSPPPLEHPALKVWLIHDQPITSLMLKMVVLAISELIQLISPSKAIWDEWARIFKYEYNISRTMAIYE